MTTLPADRSPLFSPDTAVLLTFRRKRTLTGYVDKAPQYDGPETADVFIRVEEVRGFRETDGPGTDPDSQRVAFRCVAPRRLPDGVVAGFDTKTPLTLLGQRGQLELLPVPDLRHPTAVKVTGQLCVGRWRAV